MTIVMFSLSVTVCKMLTVEMCITLTLTLKWAKVRCKYAKEKLCDFLFDGNSNVCPIHHHLRDIHSQNVHDFYVDV